jgi:hypothetical protein
MLFSDPVHQAQFDAAGYLTLPLFDAAQIARLLALYESTVANDPKVDLYESSRHNTLEKNAAINLAIREILAEAAAGLFGDHDLFGGTFMVKVPEASTVPGPASGLEHRRRGPVSDGVHLVPARGCRTGQRRSVRAARQPSLVRQLSIGQHAQLADRTAWTAAGRAHRHPPSPLGRRSSTPIVCFTAPTPTPRDAAHRRDRGRQRMRRATRVLSRLDERTVAIVKASPEFYLKEIDSLAKGRLPEGYEMLRTSSTRTARSRRTICWTTSRRCDLIADRHHPRRADRRRLRSRRLRGRAVSGFGARAAAA